MFYFAYGANLNKKLMAERCPNSRPKISAVLPNYKLIFVGYSRKWRGGVASIKPFKGDKVVGAIYEINDSDLKKLDLYEDYPNTYDRINVRVWTDMDNFIDAITYIKREQTPETKPSEEYLNLIRQGYRDWGIE